MAGPSGFQTGNEVRGSTHAPRTLLLYAARLSGVERSTWIDGAGQRLAAGADRPGPAVSGDLAREGRHQPERGGAPLPGDAEGVGLEGGGQAVRAEPLGGPVVGPPHRGRARQPRADDVAHLPEVGHHLGVIHRLGDERAGAGRVHGGLGRQRGRGGGEQGESEQTSAT